MRGGARPWLADEIDAGGAAAMTNPDAIVALPVACGRSRGPARAILATARPRQWIKNGLIVAAAGAAGALGHDDVPVRVALTVLAFCLLCSGVYAVNDVRDAAEDRLHPRKRHRPIAAGELDARTALALGAAAIVAGLVMCGLIRPLLAAVAAGYLVLTLSYTLVWRHIVWLDLLAIAGGFVLRALAGGVAAPVALSRWFVLVVTCAAVGVAAGKRLAELRRRERAAAQGTVSAVGRRALDRYSVGRLSLVLAAAGAGALVAYTVWAVALPSVHGIPWRPLTVVPFAACLLRYGMLIRRGDGEAPEELLLSDRWLLMGGCAWLVLFALEVHAAS